ncbi:MAG: thioredoxin family protein, partial [Gemmatimonadetes bacterium]|nr:thioredoxin family protein [Gemmatimonadota bacterium]
VLTPAGAPGAVAVEAPAVVAPAVVAPAIVTPAVAGERADTVAVRLFEEGMTFDAFLEATERRRETWHGNYERADIPADLAARARAVPGSWRLLVVAIDACGDSANTIPYLARFVEAVDGLEMRVVEPDVGRPVMDAHLTPDGRGATPTVVVLNEEGDDVGCWIERPAGIQSWWIVNTEELSGREKLDRKYAWYDEDGGYHTVLEVVEAVEAAARGERVCRRPLDESGVWPAAGAGGR